METPAPITIAIDYDGTFTADAELWTAFAKAAEYRGHSVYLVSNRAFAPEGKLPLPMFCAGDVPKAGFVKSLGFEVDIWIDDQPGTIGPAVSLP